MKVAIINYGAGNIQSVVFALEQLGCDVILSRDKSTIQSADKVIFPGVGHARDAMDQLKTYELDKIVPNLKQPVLGICLGMQLMCCSSEEGDTEGLGVFNCDVLRFSGAIKIPQVGWNTVENLKSPLFNNIAEKSYMYAVHGYFVPLCDYTIAKTTYGTTYSSALQRDNFYGVQFHPEKSSEQGRCLLKNFLEL